MASLRMESAYTFSFMDSFEDFGLKIDIHSCLNEYLKIRENKRSMSFFDLSPRTLMVKAFSKTTTDGLETLYIASTRYKNY